MLEIKQVYLFENNFWDPSSRSSKAGEGYLYTFKFLNERIEQPYPDIKTFHDFFLNTCNLYSHYRYFELSKDLGKKIIFYLNSFKVDKYYIQFQFLTTDRQVVDSEEYKNYEGRELNFEAQFLVKKSKNNDGIINFEFDEKKTRINIIKEKFKLLVGESLYRFIDIANSNISLKELENKRNFELCRFSSYRECFENFKIFLKNSQFFGLSEGQKNGEDTNKAIMHPTNFMERINKMIKEDLEKLSCDSERNMCNEFCLRFDRGSYEDKGASDKTAAALRTYKSLFEKCFDDLKSKMLTKEIFFYIGGKYDVDYYFKELHNQAKKLINEYQEIYEIFDLGDNNVVFKKTSELFCDSLKKLQKKVFDELYESDFIHEQFLKLLGKDFKTSDDIINLESIITDYFNMLTYLAKFYKISDGSELSSYYYPLKFNFNYKCQIVSYLKITLETRISNNFGEIEAYDENGERVEFKEKVHYFIKKHKRYEFYCTSQILRKSNIKKIKITTTRGDLCQMVEVDDYLRH